MQAIRAVERSHTVVLMIDATEEGAAQQDARLAGMALERGRGLVIALNKMDLLGAARAQASARQGQGRVRVRAVGAAACASARRAGKACRR